MGKLGLEEAEETKPETERRMKWTDLRSDLGKRDEHVSCHALALAIINHSKFIKTFVRGLFQQLRFLEPSLKPPSYVYSFGFPSVSNIVTIGWQEVPGSHSYMLELYR